MSQNSRTTRFAGQLVWNFFAFGASLVSGFILSPLVVRSLGIDAYGVWALVFSLLEYLYVADLGIRSATVKYVAHYSALGDFDKLHRTLNSSLLYFSGISLLLAPIVFFGASMSFDWFHIPSDLREDYVLLLRLTGITMAFQLLFNVPKAALEGLQEFAIISRINIAVNIFRTIACIAVLRFAPGLAALAWATVIAMWLGFVLMLWFFHRRLRRFRPSASQFDRDSFGELLRYGVPTMIGFFAGQFLHYGPPMLIGAIKDSASVGYYSLVLRLLSSLYEVISQAANLTNSAIANLAAGGDQNVIEDVVVYLNRYSLALFGFVFIFLMVFGDTLFALWVGEAIAPHCMEILPWLAGAYTLGLAANHHSVAALFGLAEHRSYSYGLVVEAVILLVGWWLLLPSRTLGFAAAWWSVSLVINRGLRPTLLLSRSLNISFPSLLARVYTRPLLVSGITLTFAFALHFFSPPSSWWSLAAAAAILGVLHLALCLVGVLAPSHRRLLLGFSLSPFRSL